MAEGFDFTVVSSRDGTRYRFRWDGVSDEFNVNDVTYETDASGEILALAEAYAHMVPPTLDKDTYDPA